jgi:hypothetical protein
MRLLVFACPPMRLIAIVKLGSFLKAFRQQVRVSGATTPPPDLS